MLCTYFKILYCHRYNHGTNLNTIIDKMYDIVILKLYRNKIEKNLEVVNNEL